LGNELLLGVRPERLLHEMGEIEFSSKHQAPVRSLAALEHSTHADDWRELMRLYLVRRTRGFIKENYASTDPADGRKYLTFKDGKRSYFPDPVPKTVRLKIDPDSEDDLYGRLFGNDVVTTINDLSLPRYGLGNYAVTGNKSKKAVALSNEQEKSLDGLSRAGKRLMGFCRTSLFKRLESSGPVFIQSLERHVLRNHVFLHALDNELDVPIGTQESALLEGQAALSPETSDVDQEVFDATALGKGLGLKRGIVLAYLSRRTFERIPRPSRKLAMGPVWFERSVEEWEAKRDAVDG
jgi:hypothetical protein